MDQGRFGAAEPYMWRQLRARQLAFGAGSVEAANTAQLLALLLERLGKLEQHWKELGLQAHGLTLEDFREEQPPSDSGAG